MKALIAVGILWTNLAFAIEIIRFPANAARALVSWETGPALHTESVLRIDWIDTIRMSPWLSPADFEVSLFMPDMGHGSRPTVIEPILDEHGAPMPGSYRVKSVYFIMPGNWRVDISAKLRDEALEETQSFTVVIPGQEHQHH